LVVGRSTGEKIFGRAMG